MIPRYPRSFIHHRGAHNLRTMSQAPSSDTTNDTPLTTDNPDLKAVTLSSETFLFPSRLAQRIGPATRARQTACLRAKLHALLHSVSDFVCHNKIFHLIQYFGNLLFSSNQLPRTGAFYSQSVVQRVSGSGFSMSLDVEVFCAPVVPSCRSGAPRSLTPCLATEDSNAMCAARCI